MVNLLEPTHKVKSQAAAGVAVADLDTPGARRLRWFFHRFNRLMLLNWRLGLGAVGNSRRLSGQIMVLTHTGRKSGKRYRTPVNYAVVDGDLYCVAGFGHVADWYRNSMAQPAVEIWLPDGRWAGVASDQTDAPDALSLIRAVLIASGFAARVAGINPQRASDAELQRLTTGYRLLRIRRTQTLSGPGGPGDLVWVWPLLTLLLAVLHLPPRFTTE